MLNIPESVKALFKQDGIRKNFRVHFPGGELPDITNDNVVKESARFTESLCSQDVLKFGLTEASVLEFETVGVANMYGMTIEAGIEIDLSSLSAAELAEIEAGSWDGVYVSESDTDLGFPFFRVPYGVFRVEKCPRDHQAMAHRRVQAYSLAASFTPPRFEQFKLQTGSLDTAQYKPYLKDLIFLLIHDENQLLANGYEKVQVTPSFVNYSLSTIYIQYIPVKADQPNKYTVIDDYGTYYGIELRISGTTRHFVPGNSNISWRYGTPKNALYSLELGGINNWVSDVAAFVDSSLLVDYEKLQEIGFSTLEDFILSRLPSVNYQLRPAISLAAAELEDDYALNRGYFYLTDDLDIFNPYLNDTQIMSVCLPDKYRLTEKGLADVTVATTSIDFTALYGSGLALYEFQKNDPDIQLSFESTGQRDYRLNAKTYAIKTFIDCFEAKKLMNGYLELNAQFGKMTRSGYFLMVRLQNDNPASVLPETVSGFWWDEYDVLPIGEILYSFAEGEAQQNVGIYAFGEGASVYDATDNAVLKIMDSSTQQSIQALFDSNFIPYIGPIAFTPIDLSMKGLPYLEAGDYLAVTAEDGMIANSFAMRQTISGIQVLTAEIESTSGDIISSEEAGT